MNMIFFVEKVKSMFIFLAFILVIILPAVPVFAQADAAGGREMWSCPGIETAFYSVSGAAYGGSLTLAYGRGASVGFRAAYFADVEDLLSILELNILLRFYFMGGAAYSGPFLQFTGGPALFFSRDSSIAVPAELGMVSAGLSLGWRFLLRGAWFVEPFVRGGYPYIAGGGLSAGIRF